MYYGCDNGGCGCYKGDDYENAGGWIQMSVDDIMENELPIVHCDNYFKLKFFKPDQSYSA
jgi:hypothetical protein